MIIKNLIYKNSSIKVCLIKSGKNEKNLLNPDDIQHLIFCYNIRLINNPGEYVKEVVKIEKDGIIFVNGYIIFTIPLDSLQKPRDCEIILVSLTFCFTNKQYYKVDIGSIHAFKNINSDTTYIDNILKESSIPKRLSKTPSKKLKEDPTFTSDSKNAIDSINPEEMRNFIISYEQFKTQFQETEMAKLLKSKPEAVDFNLKKFGISLLCKLLLLMKYVNELVDNDFQKELHEFLYTQILNRLKMEANA
jgi:hypothetical protein